MKLSKENRSPRQENSPQSEAKKAQSKQMMQAAGNAAKAAREPLEESAVQVATRVDVSARSRDREVGKAHAALTRPQGATESAAAPASVKSKASRRNASVKPETAHQLKAMLAKNDKV